MVASYSSEYWIANDDIVLPLLAQSNSKLKEKS